MTIVPRTVGVVGEALITGGSAAVQGIAMLNPQRWGPGGVTKGRRDMNSYSTNLDKDGGTLFEADDDDEDLVLKQKSVARKKPSGKFHVLARRCASRLTSVFQNRWRSSTLVHPRRS